jgi:prepilin-type N-terminal cleavage/methylation domain-containing protein
MKHRFSFSFSISSFTPSFSRPYTPARAFTLIEMMVSVALFSVVMTIVAAAYLNLINLDRQTRATNDIVNNLTFAVDAMSRSLRTGTNYQCGGPGGQNCANGTILTFTNDSGATVTYIWDPPSQRIGECINIACNTSTATYFTDPRIKIDMVSFIVTGVGTYTSNGDRYQPQVIMVIHGTIPIDPVHPAVNFSIETSASQRLIDL